MASQKSPKLLFQVRILVPVQKGYDRVVRSFQRRTIPSTPANFVEYNYMRIQRITLIVVLVVLLFLTFGLLFLFNRQPQTPDPTLVKRTGSTEETSTNSITLSNYKEVGPTIIQQTYPTQMVNVGGQDYNATQIIISAQLFIPEENDYSISSSFDHLGSLTTIDGIEGPSYESEFHLTRGNHNVEINYVNRQCLDREYIEKTHGSEAKPLSIYFSIRKKSTKQSIKNYTMFDNGIEIRTESKPYKKTDLYSHCH